MFPEIPDPLHPAVVHLPIALAVLMPLLASLGGLAIHRGLVPARSWAAVVLLQAILVGSAWLALETGEDQEERVEEVVAERHIEDHEEAAERFHRLGIAALVLVAAGLLPGTAGGVGRAVGIAATVAVLAAAVPVGHSGGELVYRHGAARAYTGQAAPVASSRASAEEPDEEREHDQPPSRFVPSRGAARIAGSPSSRGISRCRGVPLRGAPPRCGASPR